MGIVTESKHCFSFGLVTLAFFQWVCHSLQQSQCFLLLPQWGTEASWPGRTIVFHWPCEGFHTLHNPPPPKKQQAVELELELWRWSQTCRLQLWGLYFSTSQLRFHSPEKQTRKQGTIPRNSPCWAMFSSPSSPGSHLQSSFLGTEKSREQQKLQCRVGLM